MREIKFRGMDIDGRWFYGNLAVLTQNVRHLKKGHYISNEVGMPFAYQVRPETVGEYTGLKDRNGNEVYEGDIVKCSRGCPHRVEWEKEYGGTYVGGMPAFYLSGLSGGYAWTGKEQVIGNIHENPELVADDV